MSLFVEDTTCHHGINRAAQRCRICEPDWQIVPAPVQSRDDEIVALLQKVVQRLDRVIDKLDEPKPL